MNSSVDDIDFVFVKLKLSSKCVYLNATYIPPHTSLESCDTYLHEINKVMEKACDCDDIVVMGDFNLPGIKWTPDDENDLIMNPYHVSSDRAQLVINSFCNAG